MAREPLVIKCPKCGTDCRIEWRSDSKIYNEYGTVLGTVGKEHFVCDCSRCGYNFIADLFGDEIPIKNGHV